MITALSVAALRGLIRILPPFVLRPLDAWAHREAQRRSMRRRGIARR